MPGRKPLSGWRVLHLGQRSEVTHHDSPAATARVSLAELDLVRRLLFAAASLTIAVLESDAALVSDEVLEKARHLQALYGELAG